MDILSLFMAFFITSHNPLQIRAIALEELDQRSPIVDQLKQRFPVENYRSVKVQPILHEGTFDHLLIYLSSKKFHRVDFVKVLLDANAHVTAIVPNYLLQEDDLAVQPGPAASAAKCPDTTVQFISIVPNKDKYEQSFGKRVAKAARSHSLKTIELYAEKGTRANYLNYMMCPNLRGNFYDGDSDPSSIETYDGVITAKEISSILYHEFNYRVTNLWVACEAYNDPMLSSVQVDAQARKYGAGKNDLEVGPSDSAAACAMEAFMNSQPMTQAFAACYQQFDKPADQWGFGGNGSDLFWD